MSAPNLNERQAASISQQLRTRYAELRQRSAPLPADLATGAGVHDMKDEASAETLNEVQAVDRQRGATEMDDIEQALARMHAQTYGICVDCGQAIGLERLQAYPTAKRCRDCQEIHERSARRSASH
ncbi:MAG TPA: TraR/DksA family transcriptional regulator [Gammaproteobacteria bacterium]|nr:TraR/DksA family transcriptional regulator [Gammaproteobacteria bacterium]